MIKSTVVSGQVMKEYSRSSDIIIVIIIIIIIITWRYSPT